MGNGSSRTRTIPGDGDHSRIGSNGNIGMGSKVTSFRNPNRKTFAEEYSLGKDLGSGAFSVVKLAVHKQTGRSTAVKIISKKKLSEEDLAALMTEISILCELSHPHIIKCYETYDEGAEFYIVTELVAGGELFDRIVAKTHYTEKEARDLVKTFLETISYMHAMAVVHRDLKPENLLLCSETDDSDIKIADFGFAKKVQDLLSVETACGTPGYVAPEILRGDSYGTEVDIWSMGVICYVLLAGYPPFYDEDQKKLFKKIKEGKYHFHSDYWSNTSPDAMDMIRKMLCVNQRDRWTAKQLLTHAWITAGDEELKAKDLSKSIDAMKRYKAKLRFKGVTRAIIATKRMQNFFKTLPAKMKEEEEGGVVKSASADSALDTSRKASQPQTASLLPDMSVMSISAVTLDNQGLSDKRGEGGTQIGGLSEPHNDSPAMSSVSSPLSVSRAATETPIVTSNQASVKSRRATASGRQSPTLASAVAPPVAPVVLVAALAAIVEPTVVKRKYKKGTITQSMLDDKRDSVDGGETDESYLKACID